MFLVTLFWCTCWKWSWRKIVTQPCEQISDIVDPLYENYFWYLTEVLLNFRIIYQILFFHMLRQSCTYIFPPCNYYRKCQIWVDVKLFLITVFKPNNLLCLQSWITCELFLQGHHFKIEKYWYQWWYTTMYVLLVYSFWEKYQNYKMLNVSQLYGEIILKKTFVTFVLSKWMMAFAHKYQAVWFPELFPPEAMMKCLIHASLQIYTKLTVALSWHSFLQASSPLVFQHPPLPWHP